MIAEGYRCIRVFSVMDSPVAKLVQEGTVLEFDATFQLDDRYRLRVFTSMHVCATDDIRGNEGRRAFDEMKRMIDSTRRIAMGCNGCRPRTDQLARLARFDRSIDRSTAGCF